MTYSDEEVKRINPTPNTLKKLFLLSGNKCAFPGCNQILFDGEDYIGEVCHIEAAMEGGQRFNKNQTNEDRRKIENLIVLCKNHHKVTDNPKYTVEEMIKMKATHEKKMSRFIDGFIDKTIGCNVYYPKNLKKIDFGYFNSEEFEIFFERSSVFLEKFSELTIQERTLYANALNISYEEKYELSFDPRQLRDRIGLPDNEIHTIIVALQRVNLLSDIDDDDYHSNNRIRFYFLGDDYQQSLLFFLKFYFKKNKKDLIEMFASLDFTVLDT